jgi:O-antigen/teichoic acid export membrane protein
VADPGGTTASESIVEPELQAGSKGIGVGKEARPSLRRNTIARLVADGATLLLGGLIAVITARWLGPDGRGVFAMLTFLGILVTRICSAGLGEAATVFVGQGKATMRRAVRASLAVLLGFSVAGAALFLLVAVAQVQPNTNNLWLAVALASAILPLSIMRNFFGEVLMMQERIVEASGILILGMIATLLGVVTFVVAFGQGVFGAVLGTACGTAAALLAAAFRAHRGLSFSPRWDGRYIAGALKYGLRVESSTFVAFMTGRFDLLLVFSLAGRADAGFYSVALTIGEIVWLAPFALAYAAFPRLAFLTEYESWLLTARLARIALAAAGTTALALGILTPLAVPILFGEEFDAAVTPALILLAGGVLASGQWALARAVAARGRPTLLLTSFGAYIAIMVALDFVLIPAWGVVGAAVAAAMGAGAGLTVCLIAYRRTPLSLGSLLPRPADFREIARTLGGIIGELRAVSLRSAMSKDSPESRIGPRT